MTGYLVTLKGSFEGLFTSKERADDFKFAIVGREAIVTEVETEMEFDIEYSPYYT